MDALHALSSAVNITAVALIVYALYFLLKLREHLDEKGKRLVPVTILGGVFVALGIGAWLVLLPSIDPGSVVALETFIAAGVGWVAYSWTILNKELLEEREAVEVRKVELDPGLYLCKDNCEAIANHFLMKRPSLVVSREPREVLEGSMNLEDAKFWWLSKVEGDNVIHPTRLPFLSYNITEFLSTNENAFVYLDGIEYLILENGFEAVYKLLASMKDHAILKNGVILVKVSPEAYNLKEYRLLLREFDLIEAKKAIITSTGAVYFL